MNSPSTSKTSAFRSEPGGGPANPNVVRFVTLFFLGALAVIVAVLGRGEVARWHHAAALNALAEQRYEDAAESADKALEWQPENSQLIDLRAYVKMESGDFEGCLADFDEQLALAAEDGVTDERDILLLTQKAQALHQLRRFPELLKIWDSIISFRKEEFRLRDDFNSRSEYAQALNNRAYMVAQAASIAESDEVSETYDLSKALNEIRLAIDLQNSGEDDSEDAMLIDTLGYLLLMDNQNAEAIQVLERATELTEAENKVQRVLIQSKMQSATDQRPFQDRLRLLNEQYAVILHHRGEAYLANNELDKATADFQKAKQLGYDPENGVW